MNIDEFHPSDTWVARAECIIWRPATRWKWTPTRLRIRSRFPPETGMYEVQAVLDVEHNYNYGGRAPADWMSPVVTLAGWKPGAGAEPELMLDRRIVEESADKAAFEKLKDSATPGHGPYAGVRKPAADAVLGQPDEDQGMGDSAAGLCDRPDGDTPLSTGRTGLAATSRGNGRRAAPLRAHEGGQDAAHDLGDAG